MVEIEIFGIVLLSAVGLMLFSLLLRDLVMSLPTSRTPRLSWFRRLCCWIGWHGPYVITGFDGCSPHATCRWCGYEGLIDSQGGLF